MSEKPYPAGTRVVVTWHDFAPERIGKVGVARSECVIHNGRGYDANGVYLDTVLSLPSRKGLLCQNVELGGASGYIPVAWLRPLSDPDAEPVIDEVKEEDAA